MMTSVEAEKAFDKLQHLFLEKPLSNLEIELNFLNLL